MMRPVIVLTLALGACASTPARENASPVDFGDAIFNAVTHKDRAALGRLVPTHSEAVKACKDMEPVIDDVRKLVNADLDQDFATCSAIDWSGATLLSVAGGALQASERDCPAASSVEPFTLKVGVGDSKYTISVKGSAHLDRRYYVLGRISCTGRSRGSEHPLVGVIERAADAVCACPDMACAQGVVEGMQRDVAAAAQTEMQATADEAELVTKATKRMTDCMIRLSSPSE